MRAIVAYHESTQQWLNACLENEEPKTVVERLRQKAHNELYPLQSMKFEEFRDSTVEQIG